MKLPAVQVRNDAAVTPVANSKGRLLELCQKHQWNAPSFESHTKGPTNRPIFSCHVEITIDNKLYQADVDGGSTKKEAESAASQKLYETLKGIAPPTRSAQVVQPINNPIGRLNEWAQKNRHPEPYYSIECIQEQPKQLFRAIVSLDLIDGLKEFKGQASSKQEAKKLAAAAAVHAIG
jgi:dsRNA-specific ribonuclease